MSAQDQADRSHNRPDGKPCSHPHNGLRCRYCGYVVPFSERSDGEEYVQRKHAEAVAHLKEKALVAALVFVALSMVVYIGFLLLGGGS